MLNEIIKIVKPNKFLLNKELLDVERAQLWIGNRSVGPKDNDDSRVAEERIEDEKKKDEAGWRISGIEAQDVVESLDNPGWYEVDTALWLPSIYRFNIHSIAGEQAPNGTPLRQIRDGQYSWPSFTNVDLMTLPIDQQKALYLENNDAGFCFRIEKKEDGILGLAGDGPQWLPRWEEIKKNIEKHYQEKIKGV